MSEGRTVFALAGAVHDASVLGDGTCRVTGIAHDSRLVQPGDLFAALRGADFDGHEFAGEAERRGAAALLSERSLPSALPQILTRDSRAALAAVSAAYFGNPSRELNVIGITGTDGKTTTSYLLDHILRTAGRKTGMIGTVAIRIGEDEDVHPSRQTTPESIDIQRLLRRMADARLDCAIIEATSHGLAMHRLDHVRFLIGAVTNVTHEHLDFHGTLDRYRRAKAILLERVSHERGIAVINRDDAGARRIESFARDARIVRYSAAGAGADIQAKDVRSDAVASRFDLVAGGLGSVEVSLPLIGEFNVANALCAAGVAIALGVRLPVVADALSTAPSVPGRMAPIRVGQPFSVVVDYAHTPDAMEKVLRLLRRLHPGGRVIAVFGSAGERDREKRPLQGATAACLADITVVTSEDPRFEDADAIIAEIAAGARSAGAVLEESLYCRTDRREAIRLALRLAQPGDCVLLAGKGHEASIIWGREKVPWDEAGVAQELLREAGYGVSAS